jgi:hypothetical protein
LRQSSAPEPRSPANLKESKVFGELQIISEEESLNPALSGIGFNRPTTPDHTKMKQPTSDNEFTPKIDTEDDAENSIDQTTNNDFDHFTLFPRLPTEYIAPKENKWDEIY